MIIRRPKSVLEMKRVGRRCRHDRLMLRRSGIPGKRTAPVVVN